MKKLALLFCLTIVSAASFAAGHTVSLTPVNVTCFGVCNGSISSTVSGGVGPFTYSWSPAGGTAATATGLCVGSYTVTVTDMSDMSTATATATLSSPAALSVTCSGGSVCSGGCTTLSPMVSGGVAGYTYSWSGGLFGPSPSACPGSTTSYTITVSDANGCTATASPTVSVMTPTVTVPPSYSVCGGSAVCMNATATGGSTFSWIPATSLSSATTANPCASPLVTTTYTVTASYAGCTATATTTVGVDNFSTSGTSGISYTNTSACGVCDGSVIATPTGGTSPYAYVWTPGTTTASMTGLCTGVYSVIITDMMGCTLTDAVTVNATGGTAANFTIVPDSSNAYNFFMFNSSVGSGLSYSWEWGDATPSSGGMNPSHLYSAIGTMNVCLTIVSSTCLDADTLCLPATVTGTAASCLALFNIADDTTTADPNALYVYNLSYGSSLTYLWDFGDGTTSTLATPSHTYTGTGPYNLCLSVDNGAGCMDTYCDMLTDVDSLNRSAGLSIQVIDPNFPSGLTTSVNDAAQELVRVSPNPFKENTEFSIENSRGLYDFYLTDVMGRTVNVQKNITEKKFSFSREGLENGIYFYHLINADGKDVQGKLIVQ